MAAGGDGTVNEAVDGPGEAGFPEGVALVLPTAGTGNDLARTLAVPEDPERAWDVIRAGRVRALDAGRVRPEGAGERFFLNAAIGGAGAEEVSEAADDADPEGRWDALAYLRASLGAARKFRAYALRLTLDGAERRMRAVSVAVGNCHYAGGGSPPRGPKPKTGCWTRSSCKTSGPGAPFRGTLGEEGTHDPTARGRRRRGALLRCALNPFLAESLRTLTGP